MKNLIVSILVFVAATFALSANDTAKDTLKINTTAQCEMCKDRIEEAVNELDGINYVNLDVPTAVVNVVYDDTKLSAKKIKEVIAGTGYDADEVEKDKRAYKRLPKCCQLGGHK